MKRTLLTCFLSLSIVITAYSQTTFSNMQDIYSPTGEGPYVIASGDLDGDTFIDVVMGTYDFLGTITGDDIFWYKNDGNGNFTIQTVVDASFNFVGGLAIADIDGDGDNDIIATSQSGNEVVWYENNGSGFDSKKVIASLAGAGQVIAADINGDEKLDLVVAGYDADKVVWYQGDGAGSFLSEQIIESGTDAPGAISIADFDGDSDLDIVIGYAAFVTPGDIEVYYNNFFGSGTVSWTKDTNQVDNGNIYLFVVAFADIDDDGNLDIIKTDNASTSTGEVAWFKKEGDGTYTKTIISTSVSNTPGVVIVTDLNNDNFTDIIITNGTTGSSPDIVWFESDGKGTYLDEATISGSGDQRQTFGITIADFNGDNKPDIASADYQGDKLIWFENDPPVAGIDDNSIRKISIYPNPTTDKLYFKSAINENFKVTVYDILGKKVIEKTLNINETLDVSQLHTGIYIIRFDDYNSTFKFVKE